MDLELRGRTVLITGGSQGIGLATAHAFAAEGCHLHLAARTESRLREGMREIAEKFDVNIKIHAIDVSIGDNARALARACGGSISSSTTRELCPAAALLRSTRIGGGTPGI